MKSVVFSVLAVSALSLNANFAFADCSKLYALAQQHANDMARRNSLDHAGFMKFRGPAGASAENVAYGCDTEACARAMWMKSPHHRANMMLGGCQAVASAVSSSGRHYWVMEIGGGGNGVSHVVFDRRGHKHLVKANDFPPEPENYRDH